jgi:hypothetical protein
MFLSSYRFIKWIKTHATRANNMQMLENYIKAIKKTLFFDSVINQLKF